MSKTQRITRACPQGIAGIRWCCAVHVMHGGKDGEFGSQDIQPDQVLNHCNAGGKALMAAPSALCSTLARSEGYANLLAKISLNARP